MSNYYTWGRLKGIKDLVDFEKVEMIDCGTHYEVLFKNGLRVRREECEIGEPCEPPIPELNLHQMLDDIRLLVENDFCFDMDLKTMPNSKEYTQGEAKQMAWIIGRVYSIAHCTTCEACQRKYLK